MGNVFFSERLSPPPGLCLCGPSALPFQPFPLSLHNPCRLGSHGAHAAFPALAARVFQPLPSGLAELATAFLPTAWRGPAVPPGKGAPWQGLGLACCPLTGPPHEKNSLARVPLVLGGIQAFLSFSSPLILVEAAWRVQFSPLSLPPGRPGGF